LYNLVRQGDEPAEHSRSIEACVWLAENLTTFRRVCTTTQIEILQHVYSFWYNHKTAPSYTILRENIERKSTHPGVLDELGSYEEEVSNLKIYTIKDLGQLIEDFIIEWEAERLAKTLKTVKQINNGTFEDPKTKEKLSGPREAAKYLLKQVEAGIIYTGAKSITGSLNENGADIEQTYQKYKNDRMAGRLKIRTMLTGIDKNLVIKRGDAIGILGYAGQRKSTLGRTVSYNAALQGFNVLHITLEQTYEEEMSIYGIIHSHHPKWGGKFRISKKTYDDGNLTDEEEDFLFKVVIPDLANLPGKLIVRQPSDGTSWDSLKMIAEIINQTTPLDMFFVDYLTLCSTHSLTNADAEHERNIKDAKQFALNFAESNGLIFLTPIQGNRKGWEEAQQNDGVWDMTGVFRYSEFDKSFDSILSVFVDADLLAESQLKISSAKTRRSAGVPVFKAALNNHAGVISNNEEINLADDPLVDDILGEF
jgi:hypothetical protein